MQRMDAVERPGAELATSCDPGGQGVGWVSRGAGTLRGTEKAGAWPGGCCGAVLGEACFQGSPTKGRVDKETFF